MARLRVHNLSISLDGYVAGPGQQESAPIGRGGERLHEWVFDPDRVDRDFLARGDAGVGATVMGRNMFGPVRGPWPDATWRGWWGEEPPYHHDVFVITHHPREPLVMEGGTTFFFVPDADIALARAFEAAQGADVRLGGGASTVQQYLRAGLVDELDLAVVPVLLGAGERLFDNLDGGPHGFRCVERASSRHVTHVRLVRDEAPEVTTAG